MTARENAVSERITSRQFHEVDRAGVEEGFWALADPAGNEVDIAMTTPPV